MPATTAKDTRYWHGVDTTINARTTWGLNLQGGTTTGRGVRDNCEITAKLPELLGSAQVDSCHVNEKWLTSVRGLAAYRMPRVDVLISAIFRSQPATSPANAVAMNGTSLSANYIVSNAIIQGQIGRPLAGGAANFTVNLLKPGELYQDRLNALDMRFAKTLRFGGKKTDVGVDLYNLFNGNTATALRPGLRHRRLNLAAPDGRPEPPVRPVQRHLRFLIEGIRDQGSGIPNRRSLIPRSPANPYPSGIQARYQSNGHFTPFPTYFLQVVAC